MKVLLVHPYFLALDEGERNVMKPYPPLGVLYLSAYLKQAGHDVTVFDGTFQTPSDFDPIVNRFEPDLIGFYANMMTRHSILMLKRRIPHIRSIMVVGGPDTESYRQDYLDAGFQAVIVGEGESPLSLILEQMDDRDSWSSIAGLAFRAGGLDFYQPPAKAKLDLNALPFPDRQAIDLNAYLECWQKYHGIRPINLITSRGCPFQCQWCSHSVFGYSFRKRSVEHVMSEMIHLHQNYQFDTYWFADDVFTINKTWLTQFHQKLMQDKQLILPFETITRADKMSENIAAQLADLRCRRIWIGAESGAQEMLDAMKRGVTREQVIQAVLDLKDVGIETGMFLMWGYDGERLKHILETIDLVKRCEPTTVLTTTCYPIKGTPLFKKLESEGQIIHSRGFENGTDRDFGILSHYPAEVYRLASNLIQRELQIQRLNQQGGLKAILKAHILRRICQRGYQKMNRLTEAFEA